jgi:hypothetical protein
MFEIEIPKASWRTQNGGTGVNVNAGGNGVRREPNLYQAYDYEQV